MVHYGLFVAKEGFQDKWLAETVCAQGMVLNKLTPHLPYRIVLHCTTLYNTTPHHTRHTAASQYTILRHNTLKHSRVAMVQRQRMVEDAARKTCGLKQQHRQYPLDNMHLRAAINSVMHEYCDSAETYHYPLGELCDTV